MLKKTTILSFALISAMYSNETRLDESVVTNIGFEESIGDTSKNITVITREEIKNSGQTSVLDFLRTSPFITVGTGDKIDIRGQGPRGIRSVQIMVDGVSINSLDDSHDVLPLDVLDINNIEQIEIITGGGSVLYGSGTRGGVVNIITSKSLAKNRIGVGAMIGSHHLYRGRLNGSWNVTDNIFVTSNFQKLEKDGYTRGTWEKSYFGGGALRFKFLDNHSIEVAGDYTKTEEKEADNGLTKAQLEQDRRQAPISVGRYGTSQYSQIIQREKKFQTKYQYKSKTLSAELLGYYQDVTFDSFEDEKTGGKLKVKYDYGSGYVIGGYDYEKIDGRRGESVKVTKEINSLYAIGAYNITDMFSVSLGDRFEFDDYDIYRTSKYDTISEKVDEKNNAVEFVFNTRYDEDGNVYLKYERGFIAPSPYNRTNKVIVNGEGKYRINDIKSETYDTYEIGLKDMIFGQFMSLSAYYTKSYDEIQVVWDMAGHAMAWHFENLDETERYGIEAFFEEYVTDNLTLSQSLDVLKAKITSGKKEGQKISYVPNVKATVGVKYEPINNLDFFGNYTYYGNAVDNKGEKIPYHALVDVSAKYTLFDHFSIQAGVKNLFDKKYNSYQYTGMDMKTKKPVTTYTPADERTYFLELSYNY